MDSISIIPGGNTGGATEDTGVVSDNPNTAPIETGAFLATTGSIQFADTDTGPGIFHVPYATPIGTTLGTLNVNIFNDATGGADTGFIDWSYAVDNALVQYLAAGQTHVESFDILIVGYDGEEQHVTVSVTLVGTNDGPTMGGSSSSTLTEDAALGVTGNFAFNDVDILDTHTASVTVAATGDTTGLALSNGALQALLSTAVTSTTTSASGVLNYTFVGANDDFQYLKMGETLTLTYTLTIADGHGGTATSTVSINVTGSNDVPTITAASVMGGIAEAGAVGVGVSTVSGDASSGGANWVDLDHGEDATLAITDGSFNGDPQSALSFTGGLGTEAVIAGIYGTLYLQANGQYRYVLDNADIDTQSLDDGSAPTEVFNYTVVGAGAGSATSTITINIAGTNDAPVLGVVNSPTAFTEAANASAQTLSATGSFTVTDVDGNDTLTAVVSGAVVRLNGNVISSGFPASLAAALNITPATQNSSSGTVQTFNWNYTPAASDLDFLSVTDILTITYPVSVSDGTTAPASQNIVVTINGTNDTPDISISIGDAATGSVTETTGGGLTVSDTLTVTDLDLNDNVTGSITGVVAVGNANGISSAVLQSMLSITSGDLTVPGSNNGQLGWTFNSGAEGFEFLRQGETLALQYTLQVSDGQGGTDVQVITVTVTGTNDVPALSGALTPPAAYVDPSAGGAITLTAAGTRSGGFVVGDADTGDVLEVSDADNNGLTTTDIHAIRSAAVFTWYDVGGVAVLGTSTGLTNGTGGSPFADTDAISTIDLGTDDRGDILNAFYVDTAVYNPATQSLTVNWSFDNVTTAAQISVDTNTVGSLPTTIGGINVNFLGNGESLVVVFPITVTDSYSGSTTVNVPITFNGTNDQPALAAAAGAAGLVDEDTAVVADNPNTAILETGAFVTATGTKTFSDLDANDVLTSAASVIGITPSSGVTISPALTAALNDLSNTFLITQNTTAGTNDGSIVWNFAVNNSLIQGLKDGDSIVVVYRITLSDDSGTATATRTRDVTVTITGTNDVPVAVADTNALDAVIESGITPLGVITTGDATATGNLLTNDTDVDLGDTQAVSAGSVGTFAGTYGSVTIAANGTYTYTLNNGDADTNALAVGQVVTDVFNYTMQDSAGASSPSTLTITVTGTNDGPAFTGAPASASFAEEAALTATGSLAFNDVDITDVHTNTFTVAASGTTTGLALTNAQLLALFSTTTTSTAASSSGSIGWAFAGSNPAFQYLAQGESVTLTYSVTIADGNGGTATQDVAITVTGENDTPIITAGGTNTAAATEVVSGDTTINVSGSFAVTDVDLSNALTLAEGATSVVWSGGSLPSGVLAALTAPGAFVVSDSNAASNAATVNWTLAPGALDLNFLAQGETIIVTVPVTVSDAFGGSVTQNIVVTINGTNDSPIITGGGDTGSILEVAGVTGAGVTSPVSLTGNFTVSDADDNGTTSITSSFGGFATNYGPRVALTTAQQSALAAGLTFSPIVGNDGTITWTYAVANSAVDFLVEAEVLTATINVNVTDVVGNVTVTTVAVTITGSNDSVFQTGALNLTGTWNEGSPAAPAITGNFGYTDADFSNHGLQVSNLNTGTLLGAGGTLTASNAANSALDDGTGEVVWSYTLAPGAADYLAVGQSATEIFRVRVIDTAGTPLDQVVTITIQGTNDAPVISTAARDGTMNEDAPPVFSSGSILFNDVDVLDIHTATTSVVVSGDTAGQVFSNASLLSFIGTTVNSAALATNGSVDYTFTPNNAAFQYLQVGQTLTLTYTVAVSDGQGGSASQTVTVNVSGSNDGPVAVLDVNGMDVVTEAGTAGAGDGAVAGNVLTNDTDADFGDTQMVAGVQAGVATGPLSTGAASTIIGTYGSINIAADGTYTYTLNNSDADTQALDDGDVAHDIFSYTVVDSQGATSTSTIDISIDGNNDAPVIGAFTQPAAVVELVGASAQDIAAITGSFIVTDVDANDTLTPIVAVPVVLLNGMPFAGAPAALLAALDITPATQNSSSGAVQTFNYSYDPAAADLDFLNVGETLTIRYAVSVGDGDDTSNTQNIDITITGTNDTPVATGVAYNAVSINAVDIPFSANIVDIHSSLATALNIDGGFSLVNNPNIVSSTTQPHATINALSGNLSDYYAFTVTAAGVVGRFDIDNTTGETDTVIAILDAAGNVLGFNDDAILDAGSSTSLNSFLTYTFAEPGTYYVQVGSYSNGLAAGIGSVIPGSTYQLHVSLLGAGTGGLIESNAALMQFGQVGFTDADFGDVVSTTYVPATDGAVTATGITLTAAQITAIQSGFSIDASGAFTFNLPSPDYLGAGDVVTAVFTVHGTDTHGASTTQDVTLTITGTNDGPTTSIIGADNVAASLTETNAALAANGTFTVGDLDIFDVDTATVTGVVTSGNVSGLTDSQALAMFTFTDGDLIAQGSNSGSLAWAFNSSASSFDYLRATDTLTLTYQVQVIDSSDAMATQNIEVTIDGSNDAPTIAATSSVSGLAEEGMLTASGDASLLGTNWNDVDTGEDATLAVTRGSAEASVQTALTFDGAGAGALLNEATISGTYGTLYLKADGTYRYVLNNADTDTQALDDGQAATDVFNYTISDGSGGTQTSTITANIQGANDSAIITVTDLADVTENNTSSLVNFTVASRVAITDIDSLDAASPQLYIPGSGTVLATGGPAAVPGPLENLVTLDAATGTISYDRAAFNWLALGESVTYTVYFDAQSGDDAAEARELNFTITGQNDAPIAVGEAGTRAENVGGTFAVMTNDSDPDLNDTISVTGINVASVNGLGVLTLAEMADIANDFSIVGNQLVFAPSAGLPGSAEAVYDRLNPGQTATIVITYIVMDNNGGSSTANFTLSITGAAETFTGTALDDNPFNGSNGDDIMIGLNGDDVIFGNSGNDTLYGDQGNDTLNGGSGNDSLYGGVGSDNFVGGSDTDTAFMDGTWASYVIAPGVVPGTYLLTSGGFTDTLTTIELVSFAGGTPVAIATILNDTPVITGANFAIDENITGPVILGSVTATDADFPLGDIVSYSITGGNAGGYFAIDPATGVITLASGQTLDHETAATYPLTVTATDVHGASAAATVTITVNDLNDTVPVFSSGATANVDENAAATTVVYDANATDADSTFGPVTYSLSGTDAAAFNIDQVTGEVRLNASADYEVRTNYAINVIATQGATATTQAVVVTINDRNDNNPVFSSGAIANLDENTATTTVVYDANATDADATFGPIFYSLSGTDAAAFNIDAVTGEVRLNASADYETQSSYAINVTATQGATATTQAVAVTINDRNDNNPVFSSGTTASVAENAAATTIVYDANATDADASFGPIAYSLSGADAAAFNIDAVTGEVRLNASADYEARSAYAINVVATQGTTATSRAVSVSVNDLNDNNPAFTSGATGNVGENAATTTVVYDANATDADATFGLITYSLSGTDAAAFNIDAVTGEVRLNTSADYEVRTNYAINVTATQGATATTQAVVVSVNDRNDSNPVFASGTTASVAENAATTTVVYDANATDADASFGPIAYSLSGTDAAAFNIDAATGEVRLNASADYEARSAYAINVVATQGATATSRAVTVSVNDVNEFAVGALSFTSVAVNEVTSTGLLAGTALAVDGDGTATVSYALLDNAGGRFVINATSGLISVANGVLLDFEQLRSHTVTVRATSSDGSFSDGTTTITVNDVNPEIIVGSSANETIIGGAGADNISLAGGNDTLYGRGGDDILNGGAGADRLIGGAGNDVAVYGTASTAPGISIIRAANGALLVNDGSGSVDILSGIEQVQFSNVTLNPAGYARSDINGDGTSDILTYSQSTGLITRTNISNGVVTSAAILASTSQGPGDTTSGNWDVRATGDFNYDGTSDLVLKNQVTGQFYIWTFTGQAQTGSSNLGVIGTNWDVLSTADFNRDGNHDILWRNADDGHLYVWTFDAQAQQNGSASLGVLGTNWTGAGVGDFDGDGDSDVMLRNSDNGRLYLYTLENGQLSGGRDVNTFGTEWIVGGVGDFNGDGISDVALKNTNTGQFYILGFDTAGSYMGTNLGIIGTQFDIAATGDYNNDGTDDILWRNTTNNQVSIGLMEDGHQAGGGLGLVGTFSSDLIIV
jgi:VCBS repeat-containing protein